MGKFKSQFTLSPEAAKVLKDAGLTDREEAAAHLSALVLGERAAVVEAQEKQAAAEALANEAMRSLAYVTAHLLAFGISVEQATPEQVPEALANLGYKPAAGWDGRLFRWERTVKTEKRTPRGEETHTEKTYGPWMQVRWAACGQAAELAARVHSSAVTRIHQLESKLDGQADSMYLDMP